MNYFIIEVSGWRKKDLQLVKNKSIHNSFSKINERDFFLDIYKISFNVNQIMLKYQPHNQRQQFSVALFEKCLEKLHAFTYFLLQISKTFLEMVFKKPLGFHWTQGTSGNRYASSNLLKNIVVLCSIDHQDF